MSKLSIGQKLYRYTGVSIMSYVIEQLRTDELGTSYAVRCLDCRDHPDCQLLLADTKDGIKYLEMLSDNDQDYWHRIGDNYQVYELSREKAVRNRIQWTIDFTEEMISDAKKSIEANENKIKKLQSEMELLDIKD